MAKIAIVSEADSGLTVEEGKKYGATIFCKPLTCGEKTITDTITLTYEEFLEEMKQGAVYKSSQMPPQVIYDTFDELLKTHDYIIYFPISSKMSTAYENGVIIANEYNGKVHVVDHRSVAAFQGYEVKLCHRLINEGKSFEEICNILDSRGGQAFAYVIPESLKYLARGGRISPAVAKIGGLIGMTPLLVMKDGLIDKDSVCRTLNKAYKVAVEALAKSGITKDTHELFILHTNEPDRAEKIKDMLLSMEELKDFEPHIEKLPSMVICHAGPGTIAFGYTPKYLG